MLPNYFKEEWLCDYTNCLRYEFREHCFLSSPQKDNANNVSEKKVVKKKVSFADEKVGGVLCQVKLYEALKDVDDKNNTSLEYINEEITSRYFVFNEGILQDKSVCVVEFGTLSGKHVFGLAAVKSSDSQKKVVVRLTLDGWKTSQDIICGFVQRDDNRSCEYFFFLALLNIEDFIQVKKTTEFSVCFSTDAKVFWDDNNKKNYRFE